MWHFCILLSRKNRNVKWMIYCPLKVFAKAGYPTVYFSTTVSVLSEPISEELLWAQDPYSDLLIVQVGMAGYKLGYWQERGRRANWLERTGIVIVRAI